MTGWISIHRQLCDKKIWLSEPFTRGQAWVDLLMLANYENGFIRVRGVRHEVKRGQVGWSEITLAKRWKWSRGKVRRFFQELEENEQQIVQEKNNVTTLISIVNYEKYQNCNTANGTTSSTTNGQQTVQQTDTNNKNNKNNKKNKKEIHGFVPPNSNEISEWLKTQKGINGIIGEQITENFIEFYGSKNWMVGKNKMADWRLALSRSLKWESNQKLINAQTRPMVR